MKPKARNFVEVPWFLRLFTRDRWRCKLCFVGSPTLFDAKAHQLDAHRRGR